jgi:hypothetical protein
MRPKCILFVVLLLGCCATSFAQINTGKTTGFVTDSGGGAIPRVPVIGTNTELSQTFSRHELDALPNAARSVLFQMNLIPGVNSDVGSGNYGTSGVENGSAVDATRVQLASIGGVDANANFVFIHGVPHRKPQNAFVSLTPGIEEVQEAQVYVD